MSQGEPVRVCIIPTGGTIASIYDPESQTYRPGLSVDTLLSYLPEGMGKIEVIKRELFQLDSANAQPHHWQEVASCIKAAYEEIPDLAGFVILHGTDTMVYTASAVSFMIQGFGKPIVFTGSQIPTSMPWSDGPRNLRDALRVAAWADLGETCIVFNGEVHRATRVKKLRDRDHDAFDSVDPIPLGMLARDIVLYEGRTKRHNLIPRFDTRLDDRVFLLKVFPRIPPSVISRIVDMGLRTAAENLGKIGHLLGWCFRKGVHVHSVTNCSQAGSAFKDHGTVGQERRASLMTYSNKRITSLVKAPSQHI